MRSPPAAGGVVNNAQLPLIDCWPFRNMPRACRAGRPLKRIAGNIIRPISIRNGELGRILPAADRDAGRVR
ncbi:MAG: hypothetical protein QOI12_5087 [Alphaproteobacteria bacterium]|jgi:hypothetical protein|nr:hypothetical protein [Alphaproteobacteria bacterium]